MKATSTTQKSRRDKERRLLKRLDNDFIFFCHSLWKVMGYDKVAPIGWGEEDIMTYMADQEAGNHRGVLAPRGIGKTHIVLAYAAWRIRKKTDLRIIVLSETELHAKKSVKMLRGWFDQCAFLRHLEPSRQAGHRDGALMFDVGPAKPGQRDPSFMSMGVGSQLEGCRASIIIPDDVETNKNTMSIEMRLKLDERLKELVRVATFHDREIVYVGTYHSHDSVYLKLASRGYKFRTWPIMAPSRDQLFDDAGNPRILNLSPSIANRMNKAKLRPGDKIFPHRHPDAYIADQQAEGLDSWEMHQMLMVSTADEKRHPLRLSDFITVELVDADMAPLMIGWGRFNNHGGTTEIDDLTSLGLRGDCFHKPIFVSKDWARFQMTKMWVDPSGKGQDKTAYCVVGLLNGKLHVKELKALPGGYDDETLQYIAEAAQRQRVNEIIIEDEFGSGMMVPLLQQKLRPLFSRGGPTAPTEVSGAGAVDMARTHIRDRAVGQWSCSVESQTVTRKSHKEDRICDVLEPAMGAHRIVVDRALASNQAWQRQVVNMQRQPGCLQFDDEIDAFAGAIGLFSEFLGLVKENAEDHRQTMIDQAIDEMRSLSGQSSPKKAGVWFQHR